MLYWIIATFCAFFIKGLCGFANTLVFSTILSFGVNNINISPVELLLGYPANFILAYKERKHIQWKLCLGLTSLILIGSIPGIFFLKNVDALIIKIIFGFVIVCIGLEMLYKEFSKSTKKVSKPFMIFIGLLSGILCGLYGIGALMGAFLSGIVDSMDEFKANMCVIFFFENTFRIVLYIVSGIITLASLYRVLCLLPVVLIGLFVGMKSTRFLNEKQIKILVIILLILSGLALIYNSLH